MRMAGGQRQPLLQLLLPLLGIWALLVVPANAQNVCREVGSDQFPFPVSALLAVVLQTMQMMNQGPAIWMEHWGTLPGPSGLQAARVRPEGVPCKRMHERCSTDFTPGLRHVPYEGQLQALCEKVASAAQHLVQCPPVPAPS